MTYLIEIEVFPSILSAICRLIMDVIMGDVSLILAT